MCLVCRNSISIQTVLQISSQVDWPILWNCWFSQWQAIFVLRGLHSLGSRLSLIMLLLDYVVYLARKMVKQSVALLLPSCNSWLISNAQKWQQRFNNWYINTQKGNLLPVVLQLRLLGKKLHWWNLHVYDNMLLLHYFFPLLAAFAIYLCCS